MFGGSDCTPKGLYLSRVSAVGVAGRVVVSSAPPPGLGFAGAGRDVRQMFFEDIGNCCVESLGKHG
jgi:hypothetical protein